MEIIINQTSHKRIAIFAKPIMMPWRGFLLGGLSLLLFGCATIQPHPYSNDVCRIFKQNPDWYWATQGTAKRWGIPVNVQMAIIYHESAFDKNARPPNKRLLWVFPIPGTRASTAYSYSQALDGTWEHYKQHSGRHWVQRDEFSHASDFIGWYADQVNKKLSIPRWDAYRLYLAYHEGIGGYQRGSFLKKQWLMGVAQKVKARSWFYSKQLKTCEAALPTKPDHYLW